MITKTERAELKGVVRQQLPGRIISRIEVASVTDCWPWLGAVQSCGYGAAWFEGATQLVHRIVYTCLVGPIPEGDEIDHRCHNDDPTCSGGIGCRHRLCCNPLHLEPVSHRENGVRGRGAASRARETHCRRGHPFAAAAAGKRRECRICRNDRRRDRYSEANR